MFNSFTKGFIAAALTAIGLYFSWEARRMDNYQALVDLANHPDPTVSGTAFEMMEIVTSGCGGQASQTLEQRWTDIFCPLNAYQRYILTRLIAEEDRLREQARREMASEGGAQALDRTGRVDLVALIDSARASDRRDAVGRLHAYYLDDPETVSLLVDQIALIDNLRALTAQGRYNVLWLLTHVKEEVWVASGEAERTRAALGTIRERARLRIAKLGDSTRALVDRLDAQLAELPAPPADGEEASGGASDAG